MYFNSLFQIKSLKIQNFKCFTDLNLDFKPSFNLVSGLAGTGKTIIFECINLILNPINSNFININLTNKSSEEKNYSIISSEIIPVLIDRFKEDIKYLNFSKELQNELLNKNKQTIRIEVKIDPLTNEIRFYLINNVMLTNGELNHWNKLLSGNLSNLVQFTQGKDFLLRSFFSKDLSANMRYQILVSQLKLTKTISQYQILMEDIQLYNLKSNELDETLIEAKALEEELLQDINFLKEFRNEEQNLKLLENELVWAPVIQIEDRIAALTTTLTTNNQEIEKVKSEIANKESSREAIVKEINEIEKNRKIKNQEFETIRKEYLEKKSRIDKHNKQIENFEKSIKRFSFDERQKQMKISDNQRILKEIKTKKKNKNNSDNDTKEETLKEELDHLQKELEEIKEKKSAYLKEKTVKQVSKKKLESSTNTLSAKLQTIREDIKKYETKSEELVRQNDQIFSSIEDLNEKLIQIEEKLSDTDKEIKTSRKNLVKIQKEVEKSNIPKPENVRAKNTIDTLINNAKLRIIEIESLNLNKNAENQLKKQKERINTLQTDIDTINEKILEIKTNLSNWENLWKNTLSHLTQKIADIVNYFLKTWNKTLKIDLLFTDSPTSGYLDLKMIIDKDKTDLSYLSSSQIAIFEFIWQLSVSIVANSSLMVIDEIFQSLNVVDQEILLKTLLHAYDEKIIDKNYQIILMAYFKDLPSLSIEESPIINLE